MAHTTDTPTGPPPVIGLLRVAYATARQVLTGVPVTGLRWKRPARACPNWCAKDHTCSARHGHPSGEHRSTPHRWNTTYGSLVGTFLQGIGTSAAPGRPFLELRASVQLAPEDDRLALLQGTHTPIAVDLAIRVTLAELEAGRNAAIHGRSLDLLLASAAYQRAIES